MHDICDGRLTRRRIIQLLAAAGVTGPAALEVIAQSKTRVTRDILKQSLQVIGGVPLDDERLAVAETALQRNLDTFQIVRDFAVPDHVEPAPIFVPTRHDR
jgi:Protein of unknown function (DUF4089)